MPNTMQEFLATATQKAATDLTKAFLGLPEEKRNWSPAEKARTALDMVIECTLLNGYTADLIQTRQWASSSMDTFTQDKAEAMAQDWETLHTRLKENTGKVIEAIKATPDDALTAEIVMPWRTQTLGEILAYPLWNMSYHEGQINYIASILGCLD